MGTYYHTAASTGSVPTATSPSQPAATASQQEPSAQSSAHRLGYLVESPPASAQDLSPGEIRPTPPLNVTLLYHWNSKT